MEETIIEEMNIIISYVAEGAWEDLASCLEGDSCYEVIPENMMICLLDKVKRESRKITLLTCSSKLCSLCV